MVRAVNTEQAQLWNGNSGAAWVALQDMLDAMFKPFEDLLVDSASPGE
jgi:hypothetical protein